MSVSAPDSFETFHDSDYSEIETQESLISFNTPETPSYPVLANNDDLLIHTPNSRNKKIFKMKIPLPDSPTISPFLVLSQTEKLIENLPPQKARNLIQATFVKISRLFWALFCRFLFFVLQPL